MIRSWFDRLLSRRPRMLVDPYRLNPASYDHQLLLERVYFHVHDMDVELVRRMNKEFEDHYGIKPVKTRNLPYVGDDE